MILEVRGYRKGGAFAFHSRGFPGDVSMLVTGHGESLMP
jgi:hypothetical protein